MPQLTEEDIKQATARKSQGFLTQLLKSGFAPAVARTWHASYIKDDAARAEKMAKMHDVILGVPAPAKA